MMTRYRATIEFKVLVRVEATDNDPDMAKSIAIAKAKAQLAQHDAMLVNIPSEVFTPTNG